MRENSMNVRAGYIMIFSLVMIAVAAILAAIVYIQASTAIPYLAAVADRERAQSLARGGIAIGCAQLIQKADGRNPTPDDETKKLFSLVWPMLNRWQEFRFSEKQDGFDGIVRVCLVSEEGKININELFDNQGNVRTEWQALLPLVFKELEKKIGGEKLYDELIAYAKKQKGLKFDEVTQLLAIEKFASSFKRSVEFEPILESPSARQVTPQQTKLFLTDLFTVHTEDHLGGPWLFSLIHPWLFSYSLRTLLGIKPPSSAQDEKERIERMLRNGALANRVGAWNKTLKELYGITLSDLPRNFEKVFRSTIEPQTFSIFSEAIIGNVTERIRVIVKRQPSSRRNSGQLFEVKIIKAYWL